MKYGLRLDGEALSMEQMPPAKSEEEGAFWIAPACDVLVRQGLLSESLL